MLRYLPSQLSKRLRGRCCCYYYCFSRQAQFQHTGVGGTAVQLVKGGGTMDKYHIYEEVGSGQHSQVFKGREKNDIEYVAIKRVEKSRMESVVKEVQVKNRIEHNSLPGQGDESVVSAVISSTSCCHMTSDAR